METRSLFLHKLQLKGEVDGVLGGVLWLAPLTQVLLPGWRHNCWPVRSGDPERLHEVLLGALPVVGEGH